MFGGAVADHLAAVDACARADVKDIISLADGLFVVLDNDHGVARVAQVFERGQKAAVVALVEADGGLIKHIEHALQARTDLACEADALAFAAGQCARVPAQ